MKINSSSIRFPQFVDQAALNAPSLLIQPSGMYRSIHLFICKQLIRLNLNMRNIIKREFPLQQVRRIQRLPWRRDPDTSYNLDTKQSSCMKYKVAQKSESHYKTWQKKARARRNYSVGVLNVHVARLLLAEILSG